MKKKRLGPFARPRDIHDVCFTAYCTSQMVPVALFLVFLIGSLLFSGGQVMPNDGFMNGAPMPFPLFVVPDWLAIACASVGLIVVVPLVVTAKAKQVSHLNAAFTYSLAALLANAFFSFAFAGESGLLVNPSNPDLFLGMHWAGAAAALVCAGTILVRIVMLAPAYDQMRKAGDLPEGYF